MRHLKPILHVIEHVIECLLLSECYNLEQPIFQSWGHILEFLTANRILNVVLEIYFDRIEILVQGGGEQGGWARDLIVLHHIEPDLIAFIINLLIIVTGVSLVFQKGYEVTLHEGECEDALDYCEQEKPLVIAVFVYMRQLFTIAYGRHGGDNQVELAVVEPAGGGLNGI